MIDISPSGTANGPRRNPHQSQFSGLFYSPKRLLEVLDIAEPCYLKKSSSSVPGRKDFAFPTHFHLLAPASLHLAVADGPVYEPTNPPCAELPCRTIPSGLDRTFLNRPARAVSVDVGLLQGQEKKRLALGMNRDPSPTLFKALYGLERNTQQLSHLHLGFSQLVSNFREFLFVHLNRLAATVPQCGSHNLARTKNDQICRHPKDSSSPMPGIDIGRFVCIETADFAGFLRLRRRSDFSTIARGRTQTRPQHR
jgi:hypothetical protein